MDIWYTLMLPFTWLLKTFYSFFNNYGIAIILFSLVIKVILFPVSLKGKKSMIQMTMVSDKLQKLQKQYANNPTKYQEESQRLYEQEGVDPSGGCLWSFIPIFILLPIYAVVRRPLKYWLGLTEPVIEAITNAVKDTGLVLNKSYGEISIISKFFNDSSLLSTAQTAAPEANLYGINLNFLGIDLAGTPNWRFWGGGITWNSVGLLLIVVLCAVTALLSSMVMMKTNQMNNQQTTNQNKSMMLMSPLMMLIFGFIMPGAMGVYIISNSVFTTIQEIICAKLLKKDYERAAEAAKRREIEAKEEEKRLRREKAEARALAAEEARKNKGKQKELDEAEEAKIPPEVREASRSGIRQYARGRAYDPKRFGEVTTYDEAAIGRLAAPPVEEKKKKKKDKNDD